MERKRRVYSVQSPRDGWLSYLLLFLSSIVLISGLVWRPEMQSISIRPVATPTPIPMSEAFDETPAQMDFTLPSATWYALQVGAFENQKAAEETAERFMRRGAAGYVWHDGRYRVLAAVYPLREDAQNVRRQLEEVHSVDSFLYEIHLPAIQLRISGMQGQLDILQAAFDHGFQLVKDLQEMSVSMDRQEISVSEALERLKGINETLVEVSLRLEQRFVAPRHATVSGLVACMNDFNDFFTSLDEMESEVAFGMKLKKQTFVSFDHLRKIYDTLSTT